MRARLRRAPRAGRGAYQYEPASAPWVIDREALSHGATHRMANDDRTVDPERSEECSKIGRQIRKRIAGLGAACITMPPLRQRDDAHPLRQVSKYALERAPRIGKSVDENDWNVRGIALLDVTERGAAAKFDGLLMALHVLMIAFR